MQSLVAFAGGGCITALAALVSKGWRTPLPIVVAWWSAWLAIHCLRLTGLHAIGWQTFGLVYVALMFVVIGAFLRNLRPQSGQKPHANSDTNRLGLVVIACFGYVALWFISVFPRAWPLIQLYGGNYRSAVFGSEIEAVFGHAWLSRLHAITAVPAGYLAAVVAVCIFVKQRRAVLLPVAFAAVAMNDGLRMGRAGVYMFLSSVLVALVLRRSSAHQRGAGSVRQAQAKRGSRRAVLVAAFAFASALLFSVSVQRFDAQRDVARTVLASIVDYHTVGFVLLDTQVSNPEALGRRNLGLGRLTFGGIEQVLSFAIRRINSGWNIYGLEMDREWRSEFVEVGVSPDGAIKLSNAFYTGIFSLYHDGRVVFVALGACVFGYALTGAWHRAAATSSTVDLMLVLILLYCGMFSLFTSVPETPAFWILLGAQGLMKRGERVRAGRRFCD